MNKPQKRSPGKRLSAVVMLFFSLAFLLLAVRDSSLLGYVLAAAVPALIFGGTFLLPRLFPADSLLMSLTNFLCALGILLLYAVHSSDVIPQAVSYGIGLAAMVFCACLVRGLKSFAGFLWPAILLSLVMLALPLWGNEDAGGIRSRIVFGSVSFRPGEFMKLPLVLVTACCVSGRRLLPGLLFLALSCFLLMLQQDLSTSLLYFITSLLLFWAATGNIPFSLAGLAAGSGIAWYGYHAFSHVGLRVSVWQNPRAGQLDAGSQLIQGLAAVSRGGLWGTGLGLGNPASVESFETDFTFSVLCEQFGLVFGACVLLLYVALILRGTAVAMSASRRFHALAAMGAVILLGLQAFVNVGGALRLIPLAGVKLPFISCGGDSLISGMCLVGLIQGVESLNEERIEEDRRLAMLERE